MSRSRNLKLAKARKEMKYDNSILRFKENWAKSMQDITQMWVPSVSSNEPSFEIIPGVQIKQGSAVNRVSNRYRKSPFAGIIKVKKP